MLTFHELIERFGPGKHVGKEYRVRCPVHGDESPSLDISEGDIGPIFQCRSGGCQTVDILHAVGLTWADVLPQRNGHPEPAWDAVHEYRDRAGVLRYRVYRRGTGDAKVIRQQAADGQWTVKGIPMLPYRLNELVGPVILVAEGEKAVDALWRAGFQATCNTGGATKWRPSDSEHLAAIGITELVILPDNDPKGLEHAAVVEASAVSHALHTRRVTLPGLPPKGDAADWLQVHDRAELGPLLEPQAPPTLATHDAVDVIAEGRAIAESGIKFIVDGIVPAYGMLGLMVAYAKVGKTTLGQALGAAVATGRPFLGKETTQARVLIIAAEDPPEYTAYLARDLQVPSGVLSFSRSSIQLDAAGLALISATVKQGGYGLVLIASWQAVVAGLVKDENDNAGAVLVVERVKIAARETGIPWLIDAHSGKGEDQADDADPTRAMRGASGAAGAADYLLSLRYVEGGTFKTQRRLSGKGRFVNLEPMTIDYSPTEGYTCLGERKSASADTTWRIIQETWALTPSWAGTGVIAQAAGLCATSSPSGSIRKKVHEALWDRAGVDRQRVSIRGNQVWQFRLDETAIGPPKSTASDEEGG